MKFADPRCSTTDPTCRLATLESTEPRPVWAALDAAAAHRFSGEMTLGTSPALRVWFSEGSAYYAACDGDHPLHERLVEHDVLTHDDLDAGVVRVGDVRDLSRLFRRRPDLDRDRVELGLELLTASTIGEMVHHTADWVGVANHRHHPSGVHTWTLAARRADTELAEILRDALADVPDVDRQIVAEIDADALIAPPSPPIDDTVDVEVPAPADEAVAIDAAAPIDDPLPVEPEPTMSDPTPVVVVAPFLPTLPGSAPTAPPPLPGEGAVPGGASAAEGHHVTEPVVPDVEQPPADAVEPPSVPLSALPELIEQIADERRGAPPEDDLDIPDHVREAVRAALAEIEAATRPLITQGLTAEAALLRVTDDDASHTPTDDTPPHGADHHERTSALRRLISGRGR